MIFNVADIAEHSGFLKIRQLICDGGEALGKHVTANDPYGEQLVIADEAHFLFLRQVFTEPLFLFRYPCQG